MKGFVPVFETGRYQPRRVDVSVTDRYHGDEHVVERLAKRGARGRGLGEPGLEVPGLEVGELCDTEQLVHDPRGPVKSRPDP